MSKDKTFCIANWKMNKNLDESKQFLSDLLSKDLDASDSNIVISPSFISLTTLCQSTLNDSISFSSQDVSTKEKGSLTGEISVRMLENINCGWSIIGHSERRQFFNESNESVSEKIKMVLNSSLNPILCVGETLNEKNNNLTSDVLESQINSAFSKVSLDKFKNKNILIAYEPVWAIGTGVSADIQTITRNIEIIKNIINNFDINNRNIYLLYGGSVDDNNAAEIFSINDVSGFLIGTASLDVDIFYNIYKQI